MLPLLLLLVPVSTAAIPSTVRGVSPSVAHLYKPITHGSAPATWKCLDGSQEIPFDAVNDDYCDCKDRSDEPGTGACPNTLFHCVNEGHIGADILSSRVNDGLCEPECCDGSDEPEGVCPNKCKEIGEEYRRKVEAERKLRKTGSKIRSTYIAFAKKEKKRIEESIAALTKEVEVKRKEEQALKDILDRTESISAAALDHKKQSPLFLSLEKHSSALSGLLESYKKLQEREKALGEVLENLRNGYNPNYQDMAVLEAVRGWEGLSGKGKIASAEETKEENTAPTDSTTESEELPQEEEEEVEEPFDEQKYRNLINQDKVSLLLSHDAHLSTLAERSLLFDLSSYIPDSLMPTYEATRATIIQWLTTLGVIPPVANPSEETNRARTAHSTAVHARNSVENKKKEEERNLEKLYDVEWFGKEGEWKKLEDTCLEYDTGEYVYEVCMFKGATQKSSSGGGHNSLGRTFSWNNAPGVVPGSPEYYSKQIYTRGARCWNGPERSLTLHLSCGTENALLSVSEPEKCEYHIVGTTPALCLPLDADDAASPPKAKAAPVGKEDL